MNGNIKKYFTIGIISGISVLVITKVLQLGLKLIVAHLGVHEFGSYYYLISLYASLVMISSLGIPMSITRFFALYGGKKNEQTRIHIVHSAMILMGIISVCITGSIWLFANAFVGYVIVEEYVTVIRILALSLPFSFIIISIKAGLLGQLQIKKSYFIDGIQAFITFFCICIGLFVFYGGVQGALYAHAISMFITAVICVYLFRSYIPFSSFSFSISKEFIQYTWPVSVSEIITAITTMFYLTVLKLYSGETGMGLYGLAVTIASLINIFPQIVLPVFFPVVSRLYGKGMAIGSVYKKIVLLLIITSLLSTILLILGSRFGATFFFGSLYLPVLPMLPYLLAAYAIYIIFVWYNRQLLDMAGLTKINLFLTIIRVFVMSGILLVFIPNITGIQLALASGVGWIVEGIGCLYVIYKKQLLRA